eukprot:scaffold6994_cov101-Isochrysis_galbana.AAC.1
MYSRVPRRTASAAAALAGESRGRVMSHRPKSAAWRKPSVERTADSTARSSASHRGSKSRARSRMPDRRRATAAAPSPVSAPGGVEPVAPPPVSGLERVGSAPPMPVCGARGSEARRRWARAGSARSGCSMAKAASSKPGPQPRVTASWRGGEPKDVSGDVTAEGSKERFTDGSVDASRDVYRAASQDSAPPPPAGRHNPVRESGRDRWSEPDWRLERECICDLGHARRQVRRRVTGPQAVGRKRRAETGAGGAGEGETHWVGARGVAAVDTDGGRREGGGGGGSHCCVQLSQPGAPPRVPEIEALLGAQSVGGRRGTSGGGGVARNGARQCPGRTRDDKWSGGALFGIIARQSAPFGITPLHGAPPGNGPTPGRTASHGAPPGITAHHGLHYGRVPR